MHPRHGLVRQLLLRVAVHLARQGDHIVVYTDGHLHVVFARGLGELPVTTGPV
jgi:hypothetical protein